MAEDAYIKSASKQLRDAVAALQGDIRRIQRDTYSHQQRLNLEISTLEYEATNQKAQQKLYETEGDHNLANQANDRIKQLESSIGQKKQEVSQRGNDAANVVKAKQELADQLNGLAAQLESLAAAAR